MKKPPPPKPRRVPPRNPPAPREIVERALRLAAQSTPEDAAEQLKREWKPGERKPPSWRTIRRWQHGMNGQAAVAAEVLGLPTTTATATPSPTTAPPVPPLPAPPPKPEEPPEGLSPRGVQRWYIERQIKQLSVSLELLQTRVNAGDAAALSRMSPLNTSLREWLAQLDKIGDADARNPLESEARRWETAAASARKKILDGLAMARERMGALLGRPFPYAADVGADRSPSSASGS